MLEAHYYAEGQRDLENGIRIYKLWAATYPSDWSPLVNLCNQYTQLGQYEPAIIAGEQALKAHADRGVIFSVLARALMRANRFAEAKNVGEQAKLRGKDSVGLHGTLFDIAVQEHDETTLARETEWAAAHRTGWYEWYFPYSQAAALAKAGKYRPAEALFHLAYEKTKEQKAIEGGDSLLVAEAQMELNFGLPATAKTTLMQVENHGSSDPDLAVLYIRLGDTMAAQRYFAKYARQTDDTVMMCCSLPSVHAAEFIQEGRPLDAVAALEPAKPYELAGFGILTERAEA